LPPQAYQLSLVGGGNSLASTSTNRRKPVELTIAEITPQLSEMEKEFISRIVKTGQFLCFLGFLDG